MLLYCSVIMGGIASSMGLLSLSGYLLDIPWLYGPFRGPVPMAPNTAAAITCLGLAHVTLVLHAPSWFTAPANTTPLDTPQDKSTQ